MISISSYNDKHVKDQIIEIFQNDSKSAQLVYACLTAHEKKLFGPVVTIPEYTEIIRRMGTSFIYTSALKQSDVMIFAKLPLTITNQYGSQDFVANEDYCRNNYRLYIVKKDQLMLHKALLIDEPIYLGVLNATKQV